MQKIMHLSLQGASEWKKIVVKRLARVEVSLANGSDGESNYKRE